MNHKVWTPQAITDRIQSQIPGQKTPLHRRISSIRHARIQIRLRPEIVGLAIRA
jgi:hypothetical protein